MFFTEYDPLTTEQVRTAVLEKDRADGSSYQTYDSYYAVSSRFAGPYSERRLLLINGGHGNLFTANDGTLYTTLFSGALNERPAIAAIDLIFMIFP